MSKTNKKEELKQQYVADGIILACSEFISDMAVSKSQVITVLGVTGVSKKEWDNCPDDYSKKNILEKLDGKKGWL